MKNIFLLSAISLLCCSLSIATPSQTEEPETLVLSDSLSYDDINKTSEFKGNVILTRGLMRLTADNLLLKEDANGAQHGTATVSKSPKVTVFEERPETYETIYAEGKKATYNGDSEVIHLIGQSVAIRRVCGKIVDTLHGDVITYNSKNSTYKAEGGPGSIDNGRVRSVVQSRAKVDAAVEECRQRYNGKPMPSTLNKKS